MKYIAASCVLLSLNCFASQQICIDNKSPFTIVAYYQRHNGYNAHTEIAPQAYQHVTIKTPSREVPQSISFHWKDCDRQETFTFKKSIYGNLVIQPAILVTQSRKIIGTVKNQSYSSSSSSSEGN